MARDFEFSDDFDDHVHDLVEHRIIRPWAAAVRDDAQRNVDRESGELAASITDEIVDWNEARIGSDVEYAAAVEVGADPHDIPISSGRNAGRVWHHPGIRAEPYLRPRPVPGAGPVSPPLAATGDLVAQAWLRGVPTLGGAPVGSVLPTDTTLWAATGFVQARTVGGPVDRYLPVGRPVVQIDCWADLPLWALAGLLAQHIIAATRDEATLRRALVLPDGYPGARLLEVYPLAEPTRVEADPPLYARYRLDVQFHWI